MTFKASRSEKEKTKHLADNNNVSKYVFAWGDNTLSFLQIIVLMIRPTRGRDGFLQRFDLSIGLGLGRALELHCDAAVCCVSSINGCCQLQLEFRCQ